MKRVVFINPLLPVVNRASIQFLFTGKFVLFCFFHWENLLLANPLISNSPIKVLFPVKFVMRIFFAIMKKQPLSQCICLFSTLC